MSQLGAVGRQLVLLPVLWTSNKVDWQVESNVIMLRVDIRTTLPSHPRAAPGTASATTIRSCASSRSRAWRLCWNSSHGRAPPHCG